MTNAESILILVNPIVTNSKMERLVKTICAVLNARSQAFTCCKEEWPAQINFYKEVWIAGGDGTLNYFINFYKEVSIPIAIFKGGTGNDFAWMLYKNISTQKQINVVLNATPRPVDAAVCNDKIFVVGVGIGFDGEVLRSIKTVRKLGGHLGYLWIVIKKIFSFKEFAYDINMPGRKINGKFLLVMITNSARTGGGFMVSPNADITDGKLNMVLCKPLSILKRLRYLPVIEKGKHLQRDFIIHQQIGQIKIRCEKEIFAHLDGELISASEFDISVLPKKYLFKY